MESPGSKTTPFKATPSFFAILILAVTPFVVLVNFQFFLALQAAHFGTDRVALVQNKLDYISKEHTARGTYSMRTYSLQVTLPPDSYIHELELTQSGWNKVSVGDKLKVREKGSFLVALDYPYPDSTQVLLCVGLMVFIPLGFSLIFRYLKA